MKNHKQKTIGFIGFGLIGGSIALSIRSSRPENILISYQHRETPDSGMHRALNDGVLNMVTRSLSGLSSCDIIFLCAPVLTNISYLERLKTIVKASCIITDAGSVKSGIEQAALTAGLGPQFIGGHPMTGSEKTGYENASARLLENAFYILTPTEETPEPVIKELKNLTADMGAIPILLPAGRHDDITAAISHVPHILAASLVNMVRLSDDEAHHMRLLAAGGFRDITRIASSSPVMWKDICLSNEKSILRFLDLFRQRLTDLEEALFSKDGDSVSRFFQEAGAYRNSMPQRPSGMLGRVYEVYADLADEAGAIAGVAGLLAGNSISIKNIGILHNREFEQGVLRIELYDGEAAQKTAAVLKKHNYTVYER